MKLKSCVFFKRKVVVPLLALLVIGLTACDGISRSPEEYIESAHVYLDEGDLPAAIVELKNALQQSPENIEARKLLAEAYLSSGEGVDAEKEIRRAISLGMSRASGEIILASALLMQSEFQQIIESVVAPDKIPAAKRAKLLALWGDAYIGLKDLQAADSSYIQGLSLDAKSPEALTGKARLLAMRADFDAARKVAMEATASDPAYAPAWGLLGDIELAENKLDQAEVMYGRAIDARYYLTVSSLKRADVRLRKGDIAGATDDINTLKNIGYIDPALFYVEGRLYFANEMWVDAQRAFEQTIELNPKHWAAKVYLASTHVSQGHRQQALALAQDLASEKPQLGYLSGLLAVTYINAGEFSQAKTVLEIALKNNMNNAYILSMLGNISLQEGRAGEAVEYLSRAIAVEPDSIELRQSLRIAQLVAGEGIVFSASANDDEMFLYALDQFKKGNYEQALAVAQQLHDKDPKAVDPLNLASACLLASGNMPQAKLTLERVIKIDSNNASAARNLAIIEWRLGDLGRAETILASLLKTSPTDEAAVLALAAVKSELGKSAEVITLLETSLQANANSLEMRSMLALAYYNTRRLPELLALVRNTPSEQLLKLPQLLELRGKAHLLRGEVDLAVDDFATWTEQQPQSAHANFLYADALSRKGERGFAKRALGRAIAANPNYLSARIGEVKMLVQDQQVDQAKVVMSKLKQDFGDLAEVHGLEGWLQLGTGDLEAAEASLLRAIELQPNSEYSSLLANALWAQGKYERALTVLNDSLQQSPGNLAILLQLADAYMAKSMEIEAITTYKTLLERYPKHVLALNNLAWLSRERDLEQGVAYAEQAHELAPKAAGVADTLAMLLLKQDPSSQRAFGLLRQAAVQAPDEAEIQLHYGEQLLARNSLDEARKVLNTIVSNVPDSPHAEQARQLLGTMP